MANIEFRAGPKLWICTGEDLAYNLAGVVTYQENQTIVTIYHVPTGRMVTAVYSMDDARQFAEDTGFEWEQVGADEKWYAPSLVLDTALDKTTEWDHSHGFHVEGCGCPYDQEEGWEEV